MSTNAGYCRGSAGTGTLGLKVVSVTGAAFAAYRGQSYVRLSFSIPTIVVQGGHVDSIGCGMYVSMYIY